MNLETYLFDEQHEITVKLSGEGRARFRITCNGEWVANNKLNYSGIFNITWTQMLKKSQNFNICIEMHSKRSNDTKVENGKIIEDVLLHVDDIIINGVSLTKTGHIHRGVYKPDYWDNYTGDKPETIAGARTMGFNGTWTYTGEDSPIRDIINSFETFETQSIKDDMQMIFDTMDIR